MKILISIVAILILSAAAFLNPNWLKIQTPKNSKIEFPKELTQIETKLPKALAKAEIPSATGTPKTIPSRKIDIEQVTGNTDGGVCYRLQNYDGNGFTFLYTIDGVGIFSKTCN